MTKLIVTDHALQRYEQRVSSKDNFRKDFREIATKWCENALKHSKYIGVQYDGKLKYRFSDYILILSHDKKAVVTIKPANYTEEMAPQAEETLKSTIKRTVMSMVRPLYERQHTLIIEIHKQEIAKLRVHNPNTKTIITQRIVELNEQLDDLKREINAHSSLAYRHGVNIEEL